MRLPRQGEIYRHFKGSVYRVVTLAKHSETGECMVVYQALYGEYEVFARPLDSFMSEVDHEKYPGAQARYRFTLVPEIVPLAKTGEPAAWIPPEAADEVAAGAPAADEVAAGAPAAEVTAGAPAAGDGAGEPVMPPAETGDSAGEGTAEPAAMPAEEVAFELDPGLARFLDADTYEEKLAILVELHDEVTNDMLNTMAVSLDLELEEGDLEERYLMLKHCIATLERFECKRLR